MTLIIILLALATLTAVRHGIGAAAALAVVLVVVSYVADPSHSLALAQSTWQAAQQPLRELGQALAPLAQRAAGLIAGIAR